MRFNVFFNFISGKILIYTGSGSDFRIRPPPQGQILNRATPSGSTTLFYPWVKFTTCSKPYKGNFSLWHNYYMSKSLDEFHIVSSNINWVTISLSDSTLYVQEFHFYFVSIIIWKLVKPSRTHSIHELCDVETRYGTSSTTARRGYQPHKCNSFVYISICKGVFRGLRACSLPPEICGHLTS